MENPFIIFEEEIAELKTKLVKLAPKWTSDVPTVPGWYWARASHDHDVEAVQVRADDTGTAAGVYRFDRYHPFDWGTPLPFDLWCGPIKAPPIPEGT